MDRRIAYSLALSVGLAGCGMTDPGPLRVVSVTPGALATAVPITDTIRIAFSGPVLKSSINDSTVVLSVNGRRVVGSTTVSSDGSEVSVAAKLGNGHFYVLEVRSGVRDAGGRPLTEPYVGAFTTAVADSASTSDPTGDAFNAGSPDLTSLALARSGDTAVLNLTFSGSVSPSYFGRSDALGGYIDLDVDQDSLTGVIAFTDLFGPLGTHTGLGVDYFVDLFTDSQGNAFVFPTNGAAGSLVPAVFGNGTVTLRIPLAMLGHSDGNFGVAAVVGNLSVPTDIAPNVGHLSVGTEGVTNGSRLMARQQSRSAAAAPLRWGH